jgi:hypothetical protein
MSQTPMVVLSTSRGGCTATASPQSRPWTRDPCSQTMEANATGTSMVNATVGLPCPAIVLRSCFIVSGMRCGCCSMHRSCYRHLTISFGACTALLIVSTSAHVLASKSPCESQVRCCNRFDAISCASLLRDKEYSSVWPRSCSFFVQ